jgi:hypothetical protein
MGLRKRADLRRQLDELNESLRDPEYRKQLAIYAGHLRRRNDALSRVERLALAIITEAVGIEPEDD